MLCMAEAVGNLEEAAMRNGLIDYLRLAGATGVVWFHMGGPHFEPARVGLEVFIVIGIVFSASGSRPFGETVRQRARRLLLPWLAWSAVYAAAKFADAAVFTSFASEFNWRMLLYGSAVHLWYMPALFVAGLAATLAARSVRRDDLFAVALAASVFALMAKDAAFAAGPLGAPFREWMHVAPAMLAGLALWAARDRPPLLLLVVTVHAGMAALFDPHLAERTTMALAVAALGLSVVVPENRASAFCGRAALHVYLAHPLLGALILRAGLASDRGALLATMAIAASIVFAAAWLRVASARPLGQTA